ncbi:hypothetical protein K505DRAFT_158628 [Melanomma pulvis-pyrius CBS 109.77]|uniref:Secreted protein n=1 Tax=Melanomma pulvis-pyrius CBS 109.77 TaxID=1314802 RepID=A0A6A6XKL7_9PLEO|nr:hypothetical protein K505DRAFT_158628 [Melanomma pulvis-pyrius CBS 109.77]
MMNSLRILHLVLAHLHWARQCRVRRSDVTRKQRLETKMTNRRSLPRVSRLWPATHMHHLRELDSVYRATLYVFLGHSMREAHDSVCSFFRPLDRRLTQLASSIPSSRRLVESSSPTCRCYMMRVVAFDHFRNIPPRKNTYLPISIDNPTPPASAQEKATWPRTESPLPYLRFIRRQK